MLEVVLKVRHKYNQVGEHTIPHKYVLAKPHFSIPVDLHLQQKVVVPSAGTIEARGQSGWVDPTWLQ